MRFLYALVPFTCATLLASGAEAQALPASGAEAQAAERTVAVRDVLPPEYPPSSARASLAITGAAVFAGWYGLGLGASFAWPDAPGARELRIPVAGPWLALQHTGCPAGEPDCSTVLVVARAVLTVLDGVGQVGGLAAIGEALFLPTARPVANVSRPYVRAVPYVAGQDALGVGVFGAF